MLHPIQKSQKWLISMALILIVLVSSCAGPQVQPPAPTLPPAQPTAIQVETSDTLPGWLAVYFTNPNPPDVLGSGIDQNVVPLLTGATATIDVTSLDLNLPSVVNALADASKRGVAVRVVYDGTNGVQDLDNADTGHQPFDAVKVLSAANVKLVNGGRSSGLMHDKMIIVDSKTLFMGSWNLSYNDTYRNNNNLLKITDPKLIANYQAKFNELFVDHKFGSHAQVKVPYPSLSIDGVQVENYFAPEDHVMDKLVSYVQNAKKSVHYMIYTYTDTDLANAMIAQSQAGLDVQGVIEERASTEGALVPLFCAKLPVKVDGNKYTMHHKVIIIDGETVITGSFNFTKSADTVNDDNVLVIHSPAVAALYEQEFQRIYGAGSAPKAAAIKCKK